LIQVALSTARQRRPEARALPFRHGSANGVANCDGPALKRHSSSGFMSILQ
jgi:hypothetical protein